jgi:hypothetical protein
LFLAVAASRLNLLSKTLIGLGKKIGLCLLLSETERILVEICYSLRLSKPQRKFFLTRNATIN